MICIETELMNKETVKSDNFESISKEVDKARIINNKLNKKLPISFISPKDWQKHLNCTNSIVNDMDNKKLINNSREYSRIFTNSCSLSSIPNSGETRIQSYVNTKNDWNPSILPSINSKGRERETVLIRTINLDWMRSAKPQYVTELLKGDLLYQHI